MCDIGEAGVGDIGGDHVGDIGVVVLGNIGGFVVRGESPVCRLISTAYWW